MYELRPFQRDVLRQIGDGMRAGHMRQIVAMPTGSGKTVTAAHLIRKAAEKGRKSLFIVAGVELAFQAFDHLEAVGLRVGMFQGENTRTTKDDDVVVASIQTIRSRGAPPAGFVVIDEAHVLHKDHVALMEKWSAVKFVGLSATPMRPGLGKHFTNLVRGPRIADLIEEDYLVRSTAYCPSQADIERALADVRVVRGDYAEGQLGRAMNSKRLVGDIISTWQKHGSDRRTLVFAASVAHSRSIREDFERIGVASAHLDFNTRAAERHQIISDFKSGALQVLASVNVLAIGFDAPEADCAILARPTLSQMLHLQQIGRVIRPAAGKKDALILDHAGNCLRFGLPEHFEVPDLDIGDKDTGKAKKPENRMVVCSGCGMALEPDQRFCPGCGEIRKHRQSEVTYVDAELAAFGAPMAKPDEHTLAEKRRFYAALAWYAREHGYKPGWCYPAYLEKFGEKPPFSWRSMAPQVPTDAQITWIKNRQLYNRIRWAKQRKGRRHDDGGQNDDTRA